MVAAMVRIKDIFVYNNEATIKRHKNSKWHWPGNLTVKTADIHSKIFGASLLFRKIIAS